MVKTEPADDTRPLSNSKITEISVILLLLVALSYLIIERQGFQPAPEVTDRSIGVLPFVNMSDDDSNEYFSDGITEELLHALANVSGLHVSSRTSSFYFKNKNVAIQEAAQALGVATVLEGSVRKADDRVRITAQLIDANTGYHLWSGTYERQLRDVFTLQAEVTYQVVNAITPMLLDEPGNQLVSQTVDEEAFDRYLQGRAWLRNWDNFDELALAEENFQAAIAQDANFALPYIGLCNVNLVRFERNNDPSLFEGAEASCQRALVRQKDDTRVWEVHAALSELYRLAGEYEKSLEEVSAGLALRSDSATLNLNKGMTLAAMGNSDAAEAALKYAVELDSSDWDGRTVLGNFYGDQHRYKEAMAEFEAVLSLAPSYTSALIGLGRNQYMIGDEAAAEATWTLAETSASNQDAGSLGQVYTNLGLSYYYNGDFQRAVDYQLKAIELRPADHRPWGRLAESYRGQQDSSNELQAYKQAIKLAEAELKVNPRDTETVGLLGLYHAHGGDPKAAARYRDKMLELEPGNSTWWYFASLISLTLKDTDSAFNCLDKGIELGLDTRFISDDPDLKALKQIDAERFAALLTAN